MSKLAVAMILATLLLLAVSIVSAKPAECWFNRCTELIGKECMNHYQCTNFGRCRLRCEKIDRYSIRGICR